MWAWVYWTESTLNIPGGIHAVGCAVFRAAEQLDRCSCFSQHIDMSHFMKTVLGVGIILIFLISEATFARLPKDSDLSVLIEDEQSEYDVSPDGTYTYIFSTRIAILTEAGLESESVKTVQFNSRASTREIVEIK